MIGGAVVVPVSILVAVGLKLWSFAAAANAVTNQVAEHEIWIKEKGDPVREQVVRLDERLRAIQTSLDRIERKLNGGER